MDSDCPPVVLPAFNDAFGEVIAANGPLPPFAGWHMAPQRLGPPPPAIQPLTIPGHHNSPAVASAALKRKRASSLALSSTTDSDGNGPAGIFPFTASAAGNYFSATSPSSSSSASNTLSPSTSLSTIENSQASSSSNEPKRKAQQGFIILRPSTDGVGLRVAASSVSSFSDALDALRHRATPPDDDDGEWLGTQPAQKPLYICPYDNCGRKYTFTSNLRRHLRRGHGHSGGLTAVKQ